MGYAITFGDQKISYEELDIRISYFHQLFNGKLQIPGLRQDFKKVAIFSENRTEWIMAFLGALSAEHALVPIDSLSEASDVAYILNDSRPEYFLYSQKTEKITLAACELLEEGYRPKLVKLDELPPEEPGEATSLKKLMGKFHAKNELPALIIYTSGTTGVPKGVVLSYANLFANLNAVCNEVPIFRTDRPVLALLPFHHILPLMGSIIGPLYVRSTIACSPSLDPADLMKTLQETKVAIIIGVPRLYTQIFRGIKTKLDANKIARLLFVVASKLHNKKLSRLIFKAVHSKMGGKVVYLVSGGAALDQEVAQGLDTLGFCVLEGYGMTETAPMITFPRPQATRLGTCGQALPGIEIKIENEEILVRGIAVTKGYYRKEKETAEAFEKGWLKTGDLGNLDKDGYLRITGRSKELIILSNGKNLSPVEIETKLDQELHASALPFKELAVMARNDLLHGIFVVEKTNTNIEELKNALYEKIILPYNDHVPSYKQIRSFDLTTRPLPRTRLEKLKRYELTQFLKEETQEKEEEAPVELFKELQFLVEFLEKETNTKIYPRHQFGSEISLDSLSRVTFFAAIKENFSYEINEEDLKRLSTPEKLALFLRENSSFEKKEAINWKQILSAKIDLKLPKTWPTFNIFKNISYYFFKLYFRFRGQGLENIPNQGPCVFAVSHQSFLDGLFVSCLLKNKIMKNTYFYAKSKHIKNSLLRFLAATNNVIVVNKDLDLKTSIQKMAQAIREKKNIIIFPEGTRTYDGKLGELKKTFAILAKELQVPIVPVQITGAFKALPRGKLIPRPFVKVQVSFKKALEPSNRGLEELVRLTEESLIQGLK